MAAHRSSDRTHPTITFEGEPRWDDEQISVVIWARRGKERIKCLIRGEALDARFGTAKDVAKRLAAFQENRAIIEDRLRQKIEHGWLEREPEGVVTWQVVLQPSDLRDPINTNESAL